MTDGTPHPLPAGPPQCGGTFRMRPSFAGMFWLLAGVGLGWLFWQPLWHGAGLIGGDIYSYFLPQKTWYASRLAAGEFPLWNPLVGHGYPLVAESQTGAFSPFNLVAYRLLDVNTAYNVVQIVHYVLCFVFTWLLARRLGLSRMAAGLTAVVFTFAWFPPRITLEWAITTGAWLPAAVWCVESYLATRRWRYPLLLTFVLALQMLPGHYTLAFITQTTVVLYAAGRLLLGSRKAAFDSVRESGNTSELASGRSAAPPCGDTASRKRGPALIVLACALLAGFGLAAVQLAPSWELKQRSQRAAVGRHHEPGELHIPVWSWSQLVLPWEWFAEAEDPFPGRLPAGTPKTNRTEAHLYFGLVPLALVVYAMGSGLWWRDRRWLLWLLLGVGTLVYATGWLVPLTRHLPGFSFFLGPARFSIVTTLAGALLAGAALERLKSRTRAAGGALLVVFALGATTCDLWFVSQTLRGRVYWVLDTPGTSLIDNSPVRRVLAALDQPVRVFGRTANTMTMLGIAATPPYLGFGPAEYFDPALSIPEPVPFDTEPTPEQLDWLRRAGVTHLLSLKSLDPRAPVRVVWRGYDPFLYLNLHDEVWLYALEGSRGRATWRDPQPGDSARITHYGANRVEIDAVSSAGGVLVLTDLAYPGWSVTIDGQEAAPLMVDGMYRGVAVSAGRHSVAWTYRPRSIWTGAVVSIVTFVLLASIALVVCWRPWWFGLRRER